ncbi:sulfur-oxidizing protein SoxZ [Methylobacillus rhizosphaerae]|uniref:Sulfur-oxidizing protein SoxZ n=2 Tax=Methylobacillus rhizosphaerae TaxID=551994 RepID=A0A238Z5T3_9PROT|nr:sulfur-oxidizing protein SoxZ [Methylobacillus rhizosphaerae]
MGTISMQVDLDNGIAAVELRMLHPMLAGHVQQDSGTGATVHFIQLVQARHNGRQVMEAQWSTSVARDPRLVFYVAGVVPGDTISVEWHDNKGQSGHHAITVT